MNNKNSANNGVIFNVPPNRKLLKNDKKIESLMKSGIEHHQLGDLMAAENTYNTIIQLDPKNAQAFHLLGVLCHQKNANTKAVEFIEQSISIDAKNSVVFSNLALILHKLGRDEEALSRCNQAIVLNGENFEVYSNKSLVLQSLNRLTEALLCCEQAIKINNEFSTAYFNKGIIFNKLKQYPDAIKCFDAAIEKNILFKEAYSNRGLALKELNRFNEAFDNFTKAIEIDVDYPEAHLNKGNLFLEMNDLKSALLCYKKALSLKENYIEAYTNMAVLELKRGNVEEAIKNCEKSIVINPNFLKALLIKAACLIEHKKVEEAMSCYIKAMQINPNHDYLFGEYFHTKMMLCDWRDYENEINYILKSIEENKKVSTCFPVLAMVDSLKAHQKVAEIFVKDKYPKIEELGEIKDVEKNKIKIGYFSSDFYEHATSYLIAELFELHDRSKFEIIGFSYGLDLNDLMGQRIRKSFDKFYEVRNISDKDVALLARELGVDIAIDLKGFTKNQRMGIFSYRAARVQLSYLGYPGTTAAEYMDYLIADRAIIPNESSKYYSEKVIYLPHSYQINDRKRAVSNKSFTRNELDLPESGFIFCCFNNNFKITPFMFDAWMKILNAVEDSVLWLLEDNNSVKNNLRQEAGKCGVNSERLVFAKRTSLNEHLARQKIADLFLDTFPYNAHTTASDALWIGLPVLTLSGESFPSRVGASLLNAVDSPELIAQSKDEYITLAINLAKNTSTLKELRARLICNKNCSKLFNTVQFVQHFESLLESIITIQLR